MNHAAVGFRVHSGWTALVVLCMEKGRPVVLQHKRPHLVEVFNYDFRQPYHTAKRIPLQDAREFISNVKLQATKLAASALCETQAELKQGGYQLTGAALLLASGRALPPLEEILESHALIHTADGELFREALAAACAQCKLPLQRAKEKKLLAEATHSLGQTEPTLVKQLAELGQTFDAPWTQDEKLATLAAWLALSGKKKECRPASRTKSA